MSNPVAVPIPHGGTPAAVEDYLLEIREALLKQGISPSMSTQEGLSIMRWQTGTAMAEIYAEDNEASLLYVVREGEQETHKAHFKLGTPLEELRLGD